MANTTFTDQSTIIISSWLNPVNDVVYEILGDGINSPATREDARTNLDVPSNTGIGASGTWGIDITGSATSLSGTVAVLNGGTGESTASAGFDALKQPATDTYTGVVELATTAEVQAGTDTTRVPGVAALREGLVVQRPIGTLSGKAAETFIDIPSWASSVKVIGTQVSSNGTAALLVQLGTSGGIVTTGYLAKSLQMDNSSTSGQAYTAGIPFGSAGAASVVLSGTLSLDRVGTSNTWQTSGLFNREDAPQTGVMCMGRVTLSSALTQLRLVTANGTDLFDSGTVTISYW